MNTFLKKLKTTISRKIEDHPSFMKMIEERDQLAYWHILGENMSLKQKTKLKLYNFLFKTFVMERPTPLPKEVRWAMREFRFFKMQQKISKLLGWRK